MFKMTCYKCNKDAVYIDEGSVVRSGQYICDKCLSGKDTEDGFMGVGAPQVKFMTVKDVYDFLTGGEDGK